MTLLSSGQETFVIVGKLGKTSGLDGWIHVHSFTYPRQNLLEYAPWYWQINEVWEIMPLSAKRWHKEGVMIQMESIASSREAAQRLANYAIAIPRSQFPPLPAGEYYWCDLEGSTVINHHGETLGVVDHLMEIGGNDLLVIKDKSKTILIPYNFVQHTHLPTKTITVEWEVEWND